jgi:hypothetical protein
MVTVRRRATLSLVRERRLFLRHLAEELEEGMRGTETIVGLRLFG